MIVPEIDLSSDPDPVSAVDDALTGQYGNLTGCAAELSIPVVTAVGPTFTCPTWGTPLELAAWLASYEEAEQVGLQIWDPAKTGALLQAEHACLLAAGCHAGRGRLGVQAAVAGTVVG